MAVSVNTSFSDNRRAYRNVAVLVAAQAILGAQMPMIFAFGGLAGQSLAPNPCFATLPISLIVLGSMFAATPISNIMQRFGRQIGFLVGITGGILGGSIGAWGLLTQSFAIFLVGSFFTGVYMSAHGFYRFAAADTASDEFRPKAISYVMAGGLAAAIIGPQIAKPHRRYPGSPVPWHLPCRNCSQHSRNSHFYHFSISLDRQLTGRQPAKGA